MNVVYWKRELNLKQWEPSIYFKAFRFLVRVQIIVGLVIFFGNLFIHSNLGVTILTCAGWLVGLIGLVFQVLASQEFQKKGKAHHGRSFLLTTVLIDSGVYAVVRHPMYLASGLLVFGSVLISQHWLTLLLGVPLLVGFPIIVLRADKDLIEKFGDDYKRYMQKVPSVNFLSGIIRARRRNLE
jgi:protein-S-isoprenylcysteine O-methyltransferase Ste14